MFFGNLTINAVNKRLKAYCNDLGIRNNFSCVKTYTLFLSFSKRYFYLLYFKRLGHKNISVTTDVYSHLLEEQYKEENQKAVEIINVM